MSINKHENLECRIINILHKYLPVLYYSIWWSIGHAFELHIISLFTRWSCIQCSHNNSIIHLLRKYLQVIC